MYEIITLSYPFNTESEEDLKKSIISTKSTPIKIKNIENFYDERLIKIIESMLSYVYYKKIFFFFTYFSPQTNVMLFQIMLPFCQRKL
jgi:hypothetical protein